MVDTPLKQYNKIDDEIWYCATPAKYILNLSEGRFCNIYLQDMQNNTCSNVLEPTVQITKEGRWVVVSGGINGRCVL
jgi:hypothetical protein